MILAKHSTRVPNALERATHRGFDKVESARLRAIFYDTDDYLRPDKYQTLLSMESFGKLVPLFSIIVAIGSIILALERVKP